MSNTENNLLVLKQKLKDIGVRADKGTIGLIDNFVQNNVLCNINDANVWLSQDQLQPQLQLLLQQAGVESAIIMAQHNKKSCHFVYLRKNKIFEISSFTNFEENYKEKIKDLCQQ